MECHRDRPSTAVQSSTPSIRGQEPQQMRDRVKELALEFLIKHGYRGVSFGDLADALETTRANIHYHFGNKDGLVEAVLEDYVDVTSADRAAEWVEPEAR